MISALLRAARTPDMAHSGSEDARAQTLFI